jgi:excisionase family DNA binding protein
MEHSEKMAFTYRETAEAAGISVPMVMKLVRTGKLECIRIGRCVRIPRHAVLQLCGVHHGDTGGSTGLQTAPSDQGVEDDGARRERQQ